MESRETKQISFTGTRRPGQLQQSCTQAQRGFRFSRSSKLNAWSNQAGTRLSCFSKSNSNCSISSIGLIRVSHFPRLRLRFSGELLLQENVRCSTFDAEVRVFDCLAYRFLSRVIVRVDYVTGVGCLEPYLVTTGPPEVRGVCLQLHQRDFPVVVSFSVLVEVLCVMSVVIDCFHRLFFRCWRNTICGGSYPHRDRLPSTPCNPTVPSPQSGAVALRIVPGPASCAPHTRRPEVSDACRGRRPRSRSAARLSKLFLRESLSISLRSLESVECSCFFFVLFSRSLSLSLHLSVVCFRASLPPLRQAGGVTRGGLLTTSGATPALPWWGEVRGVCFFEKTYGGERERVTDEN